MLENQALSIHFLVVKPSTYFWETRKTQLLNFYNIDDKLRFVDVPGYGYARVSKKNVPNGAK